jgi:hypothetical protein
MVKAIGEGNGPTHPATSRQGDVDLPRVDVTQVVEGEGRFMRKDPAAPLWPQGSFGIAVERTWRDEGEPIDTAAAPFELTSFGHPNEVHGIDAQVPSVVRSYKAMVLPSEVD